MYSIGSVFIFQIRFREQNILTIFIPFVRKTGHKKKLNSAVHFPEVIEMSPYVYEQPPSVEGAIRSVNKLTYDLVAVLIHRGPSAYSGHYIGKS